jgi:Tfp pilus assembly ATPase PilU
LKGVTLFLNKIENFWLLEGIIDYFPNEKKCVKMHDLVRDMALQIVIVKRLQQRKHGGNRWSGTVKTLRMYPSFGSFGEKREYIFDLSFIDTSINLLLTYFLSLLFSLIFFL